MSNVTRILSEIEQGDPAAAEKLLPLVYDELRKLAAQKMAQERPGQTLQATALVHEAYLRLVGPTNGQQFNGRGHFFGAAAEAMRRILIENARRKMQSRHGGDVRRIPLDESQLADVSPVDDLLALNDALSRLERQDAALAELVKLRYFVGLTMPQAADVLGLSLRSAERNWTYVRTWLHRELHPDDVEKAN
jgi:RNA polymerase sigma factor (TIGR02999 family)